MPRYGGWDEWSRESGEDRSRREGGGGRPQDWGASGRREPERFGEREADEWGSGASWPGPGRGREAGGTEDWRDDAWRRRGTWPRDEADVRFGRAGGDWRGREAGRDEWRDEPWRGRGLEGRSEWRPTETWRGREEWGRGREDWRGVGRGTGREIDPPWVERGPGARARGESRGLVEWEDRGPLAWLGDRLRGSGRAGRGPKGYQRSDERIHEEVCERIARAGVDVDEVEVKVEKGEVTLTGSVRSRGDKWRLEDVVDDVFGVDEVNNHLRVSRRDETMRPGGDGGGLAH
jgi:hypothetical protein